MKITIVIAIIIVKGCLPRTAGGRSPWHREAPTPARPNRDIITDTDTGTVTDTISNAITITITITNTNVNTNTNTETDTDTATATDAMLYYINSMMIKESDAESC